jgi:hypothetical protein
MTSLDLLAHFRDPANLAAYGENCLTVRTKEGKFARLVLNSAQVFAHSRLESQRLRTGKVRALFLKGRQQGLSTYIAARFYQRASLYRGINVFILSHEQASSDTLFGIVDRYQRNNPLSPHVGVSNTRELELDRLESSYAVATAGAKGVGRSKALTLFHGSEVAFWQNAKDHFAASVQAVPHSPGTEVILESTSAGPAGEFYERFSDAMNDSGDEGYEAIFVPWHMSPEYAVPVPVDFHLSDDAEEDGEFSEAEYARLHGLSNGQMAWRRMKIREVRDAGVFRRDSPASTHAVWSAATHPRRYIPPAHVFRARKNPNKRGAGPLVFGIDPASSGGDRFAIAARRGAVVEWVRHRDRIDILEALAWVKSEIEAWEPARVFIDGGNIGVDLITMLRASGPQFVEVVRGVNFGQKSEFKLATPKLPGPVNRRAEMYSRCKDWLTDPSGASIPDDDMLEADLTAPRLKPQLNNDFLLEAKKDMKARGVRSPDLADAIALTFATLEFIPSWSEPRRPNDYGNMTKDHFTAVPNHAPSWGGGSTGWMS